VRISAALIWYDESPEDLAACVRGVAEIADAIVAVDGAYRRYPDAEVSSPPEQAEAIRETANTVGIEADVVIPSRLWAGQIEKRTFTLTRASGADWIAVVDTDWIVHADRDATRTELARTTADVVAVPFYTPPAGEMFATGWHRKEAGRRTWQPHFFRPLPGIRVEGKHYQVSARKDGQWVWMRHAPTKARVVLPMARLASEYVIEHRSLFRDERHILAGRAFCNDRILVLARTGQEDHVPGLPEPVFDYVTVPYE